ncbi:hypothetical protein PROFUN_08731 [Planoprotostelium fungivorum]|uniref:C2 domain-containing protein n=1 Tax=Planoprotostelium fungivorum TaxID=1890364 RepID=A0A2P6ND35_9EUKA|nr:hypothetical protein PROFUN_08731 [Planoprotostelium fungivorum]
MADGHHAYLKIGIRNQSAESHRKQQSTFHTGDAENWRINGRNGSEMRTLPLSHVVFTQTSEAQHTTNNQRTIMNMNGYNSNPMDFNKPNYPPPQQAFNGPPPMPYGQGSVLISGGSMPYFPPSLDYDPFSNQIRNRSEWHAGAPGGGAVLPPSMAGQFQGEMPQPQFGAAPQSYNAPPANFNAPPPNYNQPSPSVYNQPPPPQSNYGAMYTGQPNNAPPANYNQPPPSNYNQPPNSRVGANGRPEGPAFTGAGNPAYASVAPVAGLGQNYNAPPSAAQPAFNPQASNPAMSAGGMNHAALNEANATFELTMFGERLARKDLFSKSDPFLQIISASGDVVYKSETIMNDQSPRWKPFHVSLARLGGSVNQPFTIEIWDWDKNLKHDFIGKAVMTMRDLQTPGASFQLAARPGLHIQNPGKIGVQRCNRVN